jgi:GMP synthase-like glutamine amidotransferase
MLCAVLIHPDQSEVFVMGTEPIQQQDGSEKNDCERNASKRLVDWLSTNYKDERLILGNCLGTRFI